MRRGRRRGRGADEINLTPLLDVLFTILFIVMLAGTQNERTMQEDAEEARTQAAEMEKQVTELDKKVKDLEEENSVLTQKTNRQDKIDKSSKQYESSAVIVTFINEVEDGNHILKIYKGKDEEAESFRLGTDRTEYTRMHVSEIIKEIAKESADHPVFIVFHCDTNSIYRKEEFNPIRDALEEQRKNTKEVFYQIVEE